MEIKKRLKGLRFRGVKFRYASPREVCYKGVTGWKKWLFMASPLELQFGWHSEQTGEYLFFGLFYLAWSM